MSLTSRHPLRKSCSFCRARKIKCSNETICEACRKQNVDCVYDWDSRPPKGRTVSTDSMRGSDAGLRHGDFGSITPQRQRSSTGGSPKSSPTILEEPMSMDGQVAGGETVATALIDMWNENFSDNLPPTQKLNPWQERISAYHRTLTANMQDRSESVTSKFTSKNVKYTGISTLLSHDLVGLVCDKFGSLSTTFMESGGGRLFLTGLINDHTQSMFDSTPPGPSPLTEYGNRQITQMVDVWFSVHPLCFLVSKTLLLRELRDGTHDEILLAVILADASFSIGDDVAMARGQVLIRWAAAQLRNRVMTSPRSAQGGMPGAGMSLPGISTAQVLMLLGWNALCQGQMRRATCYVGLSGRMSGEIKDQISSSPAPMTTSRINGIDVFEVEKEVIAYLYWTTYTMTLFVFMQMGNHFSQLLPTSLTSIFLPVDETTSVLIRLDEVSDNFSTLQKQKAMIKEMWPLAHIASITAYIYNLYPQEPETTEVNTNFWQEAPLLALQRIQQGTSPQDMACVCREVYRVLMESIHLLNRQVAHAPSRSLVLAVYHTIAIHLLFPATLPGSLPSLEPITPEIIERYIASAQELVNLYHQVTESNDEPMGMMPQSRNCFPDVFCLALDTCARAMSYILGQKKAGCLMIEMPVLQLYDTRLEALASRLHIIAQSDYLNIGGSSTLRTVKKHLKAVMRSFGNHNGHNHSHSQASTGSSPENSRRNSSLPHTPPIAIIPAHDSDRLSTATTTVDHSASSFVSPMDTTMLPSSDCGGPADTITTSEVPTPFNHFSPDHDGGNPGKPDWRAADDLFHHVMDHSALGTPTAPPEHLNLADLVDIQSGWFPGNQMLMDFDMNAAHLTDQWQWPPAEMGHDAAAAAAAAGGDMDTMFYFRSDRK